VTLNSVSEIEEMCIVNEYHQHCLNLLQLCINGAKAVTTHHNWHLWCC